MSEARRQLFVIPDPKSLNAPSQLIRLFQLFGDELIDLPENVTRPEGIRTIRISDGFPYDARPFSEELNTVLFSFHTDPATVGQYTPPEWQHIANFTLNATRELETDPTVGRDALYIFLDSGYAHILYPENGSDKVPSHHMVWKAAVLRFLQEQSRRLRDSGARMAQFGHAHEDDNLLEAGKRVVTMSRRMLGLVDLINPEIAGRSPANPWPHPMTPTMRRPDRIEL